MVAYPVTPKASAQALPVAFMVIIGKWCAFASAGSPANTLSMYFSVGLWAPNTTPLTRPERGSWS